MGYIIYNQKYQLYAGEPTSDGFRSVKNKEDAHVFNDKENADSVAKLLTLFAYGSSCSVINN